MVVGYITTYAITASFLQQLNWPPRCNWNIVERSIKHNNPNSNTILSRKKYTLDVLIFSWYTMQCLQENFWAPGQKETWPPPPILQIMILKLSPPRCVISKESVQQKWIHELWSKKTAFYLFIMSGPLTIMIWYIY